MKLYEILYYFYSTTDQTELAFDAMLKKCRSFMTGNYLASEESVKKVLTAGYSLIKFVVEKDYSKKFFEVKMLCRSIMPFFTAATLGFIPVLPSCCPCCGPSAFRRGFCPAFPACSFSLLPLAARGRIGSSSLPTAVPVTRQPSA